MKRLLACALAGAAALCAQAAPASAQDGAARRQLGAELTFGQLDEDYLLTLNPKFYLALPELWMPGCAPRERDACGATLRLGMHAPLRLRVDDNAPVEGERLRMEDWDEPGDYLRVLRFISYGDPGQPLSFRFGELGPLTLGGGTLVFQHFNTITPDNYRPGARLSVGGSTVYGDLFMDNVTDPALIGADLIVRPLGFISNERSKTPLGVGLTVISDIDAPTELVRDEDGAARVDIRRYPDVEASQVTTWIGGRVFYDYSINDQITLTPSLDGNVHVDVGQGAHFGLRGALRDDYVIEAELEVILASAGYLPRLIGPTYAIDRYQLSGHGLALPGPALRVAATLRDRGADATQLGFFARVAADLPGSVGGEIAVQRLERQEADLAIVRLYATPVEALRVSAYVAKNASEVFEPAPALIATELRLNILPALYMVGRYGLSWRLEDSGEYDTVPDWNIGVGGAW